MYQILILRFFINYNNILYIYNIYIFIYICDVANLNGKRKRMNERLRLL
jgi:hypothetical protein